MLSGLKFDGEALAECNAQERDAMLKPELGMQACRDKVTLDHSYKGLIESADQIEGK